MNWLTSPEWPDYDEYRAWVRQEQARAVIRRYERDSALYREEMQIEWLHMVLLKRECEAYLQRAMFYGASLNQLKRIKDEYARDIAKHRKEGSSAHYGLDALNRFYEHALDELGLAPTGE